MEGTNISTGFVPILLEEGKFLMTSGSFLLKQKNVATGRELIVQL
jgi:hypothetical protein